MTTLSTLLSGFFSLLFSLYLLSLLFSSLSFSDYSFYSSLLLSLSLSSLFSSLCLCLLFLLFSLAFCLYLLSSLSVSSLSSLLSHFLSLITLLSRSLSPMRSSFPFLSLAPAYYLVFLCFPHAFGFLFSPSFSMLSLSTFPFFPFPSLSLPLSCSPSLFFPPSSLLKYFLQDVIVPGIGMCRNLAYLVVILLSIFQFLKLKDCRNIDKFQVSFVIIMYS